MVKTCEPQRCSASVLTAASIPRFLYGTGLDSNHTSYSLSSVTCLNSFLNETERRKVVSNSLSLLLNRSKRNWSQISEPAFKTTDDLIGTNLFFSSVAAQNVLCI